MWFSGPPLVPGQVKIPTRPTHSLEYLEYLVKKKKGEPVERASEGPRGKRYKVDREPLEAATQDGETQEDEGAAWWAQGMSDDQVLGALQAVIDSA